MTNVVVTTSKGRATTGLTNKISTQHSAAARSHTPTSAPRPLSGVKLCGLAANKIGVTKRTPAVEQLHQLNHCIQTLDSEVIRGGGKPRIPIVGDSVIPAAIARKNSGTSLA